MRQVRLHLSVKTLVLARVTGEKCLPSPANAGVFRSYAMKDSSRLAHGEVGVFYSVSYRGLMRIFWTVCVFFPGVALWLACVNANAASFDCNRASTDTEKTICANAELSKRDERLARAYREALSKITEAHAKKLLQEEQSAWPATRDKRCSTDETCLHLEYSDRIIDLELSVARLAEEQQAIDSPKVNVVLAEQLAIQKILRTVAFKGDNGPKPLPRCEQMLTSLKTGKGVVFLMPQVSAADESDPALDRYKNQCPNDPVNEFTSCDPRIWRLTAWSNDPMERQKQAREVCDVYLGKKNWRVYVLSNKNPRDKWPLVVYVERKFGPVNRLNDDGTSRVLQGFSDGGYRVIDLPSCLGIGGVRTNDRASFYHPDSPADNHNAVIQYLQTRYVVDLYEFDGFDRVLTGHNYQLDITPLERKKGVSNTCHFKSVTHN